MYKANRLEKIPTLYKPDVVGEIMQARNPHHQSNGQPLQGLQRWKGWGNASPQIF